MQISLPDTHKDTSEQNTLEKGTSHVREFLAKFSHDWMIQSAAGLAYNLMVAVVPIGIALIALLGFTLGRLSPANMAQLIERINHIFPSAISSQNVLQPAITRLNKSAGLLAILAVVTALFGGSRLFIAIERCFDIIYRTHPRKAIPQNLMALGMMLVFVVLTPIMALASALPAILLAMLQNSVFSQIPLISQLAHNQLLISVAGILGSLLVAWILFQATYMVVPHQTIRLKKSWKGSLVAAVLLELFLALFPWYITHFMSSYTGVAGFAVIFLLFFYYFALILLFGAEVNAYFAEGVRPLPDTLAVVLANSIDRHTGQPTGEQSMREMEEQARSGLQQPAPAQASSPHRKEQTGPEEQKKDKDKAGQHVQKSSVDIEQRDGEKKSNPVVAFFQRKKASEKDGNKGEHGEKAQKHFQPATVLPTVVGTVVAFTVTARRLREKTYKEISKTF